MTEDVPAPADSASVDMPALLARVGSLERRADHADEAFDTLEAAAVAAAQSAAAAATPAVPADDASGGSAAGAAEQLDMDRLYDWVQVHIGQWAQRKIPMTNNAVGGIRWCAQWFEHPEAISRFEACRRAWTGFVVDERPEAMVIYFRDFFDRTMDAVTHENGPFNKCTAAAHVAAPFVPIAAAPWRTP